MPISDTLAWARDNRPARGEVSERSGPELITRVRLLEELGIGYLTLARPTGTLSTGEAQRVLLRRLPWQVLVGPDCRGELEHLLLLAAERGVPVFDYPDMPYSAIGLIRPDAGADL